MKRPQNSILIPYNFVPLLMPLLKCLGKNDDDQEGSLIVIHISISALIKLRSRKLKVNDFLLETQRGPNLKEKQNKIN